MKKTLYLMRHGQTLFNLQHKIQGWCELKLPVNILLIIISLLIMPIRQLLKEPVIL